MLRNQLNIKLEYLYIQTAEVYIYFVYVISSPSLLTNVYMVIQTENSDSQSTHCVFVVSYIYLLQLVFIIVTFQISTHNWYKVLCT